MIELWASFVGAENHWKWLSFAVLLGIAELFVPGIFLIWIAASAAVVGVVTLLVGIEEATQLVLFGALALGSVYSARRWYKDNPVASEDPLLNDRGARMIGTTVQIVEPVSATSGRVKVGDSVWPARGETIATGELARIIAVTDGVVQVEKLD